MRIWREERVYPIPKKEGEKRLERKKSKRRFESEFDFNHPRGNVPTGVCLDVIS